MSEINRGGNNVPKSGEKGFQKSTVGKIAPTPSSLANDTKKPILSVKEKYESLVQDKNSTARVEFAVNLKDPIGNLETFEKLAEDKEYDVREALLRNQLTPTGTINKMWKNDRNGLHIEYLTANPNTSKEILDAIVEPGIFETQVMINISKNPNSSQISVQKVDEWLAEEGIVVRKFKGKPY